MSWTCLLTNSIVKCFGPYSVTHVPLFYLIRQTTFGQLLDPYVPNYCSIRYRTTPTLYPLQLIRITSDTFQIKTSRQTGTWVTRPYHHLSINSQTNCTMPPFRRTVSLLPPTLCVCVLLKHTHTHTKDGHFANTCVRLFSCCPLMLFHHPAQVYSCCLTCCLTFWIVAFLIFITCLQK